MSRFRYWLLALLLAGCSKLPLEQLPSANHNDRVQFLVLHFTAEDFATSVAILVKGNQVSSHYLIPQDGDPSYPYRQLKVFQLVDEQQRAWHAGASYWQGRRNLNDISVGVELVNLPRCQPPPYPDGRRQCQYPDFDPAQISLLVRLAKAILARHPDIGPTQVVGHGDVAPSRKDDPGPRFPWQQLAEAGIGAWYDEEVVGRYQQAFAQQPPSLALVQAALGAYGYGVLETGLVDRQTEDTLLAFQRHFLPQELGSGPSPRTVAVLFALLERYFPDQGSALWARYQQGEPQAVPQQDCSCAQKK
ncbi:N-acetylmuramoyl-L-alanine amidase [Gallaecimonas kandeliae]|uniref:N-acetylmuramoyl-L-alanine amidase n=1 Tax=Gallaecimonas kandeliae TaxID=3029055 RepID=UPI0026479988|nr:N-acetylmuramoyl-L-alanine amidase [Gallaecimonas kandeliae]WKE66326.1 N-acetylmuramoyl-L-alanine amidase [Gallaecimonas kandeliae]